LEVNIQRSLFDDRQERIDASSTEIVG